VLTPVASVRSRPTWRTRRRLLSPAPQFEPPAPPALVARASSQTACAAGGCRPSLCPRPCYHRPRPCHPRRRLCRPCCPCAQPLGLSPAPPALAPLPPLRATAKHAARGTNLAALVADAGHAAPPGPSRTLTRSSTSRLPTSRWRSPTQAMPSGRNLCASTMTRGNLVPTTRQPAQGHRGNRPQGTHPLGTTDPRPGFRLVAGGVTPRRSWRLPAPTKVPPNMLRDTPQNPRVLTPPPHLHSCVDPPARACLRVSVDLTRSARCSPHTHAHVWLDGRGRRRRIATSPRSGRIDTPPRLPPPGRLRPRMTVRVRDRPIGCHHARISPG